MLSSKWLVFLVSKIKTSTQKFRIVNWKESLRSDTRLLGNKFSDVKDMANASYGVLRTLRKLKHFTDFHLVQETCRVACNIKAWLLWLGLFIFARILFKTSSKHWICCRKFCPLRDLHDSSYPTEAEFNNCFIISKYFQVKKKARIC